MERTSSHNAGARRTSASFLRKEFHDLLFGYTAEQSTGKGCFRKGAQQKRLRVPRQYPSSAVPKEVPEAKWVAGNRLATRNPLHYHSLDFHRCCPSHSPRYPCSSFTQAFLSYSY